MRKFKQWQKKLRRTLKALDNFIKSTIKNYKTMRNKIKGIWLLIALFIMCSCGSTRVSVEKPAQGTQTTITVTTNNPITTNVSTDADASLNTK